MIKDLKIYEAKTYSEDISIKEMAKEMIKNSANRLFFITKEGVLIGVVTHFDIVKAVSEDVDLSMPIKTIMNKPEAVKESDEEEFAYLIMKKYNIDTCPVIDEKGVFKGYVRFMEVYKAIFEKFRGE